MNASTLKIIARQSNDPINKARNLWVSVYYPILLLAARNGDTSEELNFATITGTDAAQVILALENFLDEGGFSYTDETNVYTVSWA